ncbi:MAG: ATP-dependent DNA ligase, partial [Flavitalea sp.]
MKAFSHLVHVLGTTTKTNEKLQALTDYFSVADDSDKVWVIAIFSGRRPKRAVNSTLLSNWAIELADIPSWLFVESYSTVGDLAETISLLLPEKEDAVESDHALTYYIEKFITIEKESEEVKKAFILSSWNELDQQGKFVFNKLITGNFRIGVSQKLMVNALAKVLSIEPSIIAHRISGNWDPVTTKFDDLLSEEATTIDDSKPYPFFLAYALEDHPSVLGDPMEWQVEWKWDGIRGQIIKRNDQLFVWSRGEELMTDKFIEYHALTEHLPDGIALDGEILPYNGEMPLSFNVLQTRIGRKNVSKKQLLEAPIAFFAYDLMEYEGKDLREQPLEERRLLLERIVSGINHPILKISPKVEFEKWDELVEIRKKSRDLNSEGLMLKRKSSAYQV